PRHRDPPRRHRDRARDRDEELAHRRVRLRFPGGCDLLGHDRRPGGAPGDPPADAASRPGRAAGGGQGRDRRAIGGRSRACHRRRRGTRPRRRPDREGDLRRARRLPLRRGRGSMTTSYAVQAYNPATASENKIHDDEVARTYGFQGGLVPGVTVYAYMTHPVAETFGRPWLEHG